MSHANSPEQLHVRFTDAFNRRDLDAIVALYERDAVLVGIDAQMRGHDAIREAYGAVFAVGSTLELRTLAVNRAVDLAMLHAKWTLRQREGGGSEIVREGLSTETVRLQRDGQWLFVIDNPWAGTLG